MRYLRSNVAPPITLRTKTFPSVKLSEESESIGQQHCGTAQIPHIATGPMLMGRTLHPSTLGPKIYLYIYIQNMHSISNRKFCCFYVDFRRANIEPFLDFRIANTEPSVYLRRANRETYWKQNLNLSKRVGKDRVFLGLAGLLLGISLGLCPREIPRRVT